MNPPIVQSKRTNCHSLSVQMPKSQPRANRCARETYKSSFHMKITLGHHLFLCMENSVYQTVNRNCSAVCPKVSVMFQIFLYLMPKYSMVQWLYIHSQRWCGDICRLQFTGLHTMDTTWTNSLSQNRYRLGRIQVWQSEGGNETKTRKRNKAKSVTSNEETLLAFFGIQEINRSCSISCRNMYSSISWIWLWQGGVYHIRPLSYQNARMTQCPSRIMKKQILGCAFMFCMLLVKGHKIC